MSEKRKKFMQKLSGVLADSEKPSDFNEESRETAVDQRLKTIEKSLQNMYGYVYKAKYIKRTGTPGNYKYTYSDEAPSEVQKQEEADKDKYDAQFRPSLGTVTSVPLVEHHSDSDALKEFKRLLKHPKGQELRSKIGYNPKKDTNEVFHPDAQAIIDEIKKEKKKEKKKESGGK